jgi:hypothetical protein
LDLRDNLQTVLENNLNNIDYSNPQLLGDSFMTTQITKLDSESIKDSKIQGIDNKLALVDISDCLKILKSYYNLTNEENLVLVTSDIGKSFTAQYNKTNLVSFNIINSATGERLNTSLCNDIKIKTPINDKGLNLTLYNQLKNDDIDVYNPNDKAFTSRCYSHIDPRTGYSTTVNYRIENYYRNRSIICSKGCKYISSDNNNYAVCQCGGATKTNNKFINSVSDLFLTGVANINIDLILCYNQVFSVH